MTAATAWYREGSVSVTSGSKAIVGAGTAWLSQVLPGDLFYLADANGNLTTVPAEVDVIGSDTAITLKAIWPGSTASGVKYGIIRHFNNTQPADLSSRLSKLIAGYQVTVDQFITLLTSSGTVTLTGLDGNSYTVQGLLSFASQMPDHIAAADPHPQYTTSAEMSDALTAKEPTITAGTAAQYWRGDKTWRDLAADVRAAVLTGLSTATNAAIVATDTVLSALGKLQAQINARLTIAAADTVYTFPTVRPSLLLNFANSMTVDPRISFARASTATYYDANGVLKTAAANVPRIDHDPVTGKCKGLLIEERRTNLLTYSAQFDNATWSKTANITIAPNTTMAPDASISADTWTRTSVSAAYVAASITKAASPTTYTLSYWVKKSVGNFFALRMQASYPNMANVTFDLSNGTISTAASSNTFTSPAATIVATGGGWFRVSLTATTDSGTSLGCFCSFSSNGVAVDGTDSVASSSGYLWGAQLETSKCATSYIPSAVSFISRASTATFIGGNGLIQTAAVGVARMQYNPEKLSVSPKLLLEESRTNLLTYSETFYGTWALANSTITTDATTAPDGTVSMDKLVENTATGGHNAAKTIYTATASTYYAYSVFVKAGERTALQLSFTDTVTGGFTATFDLTNVTATPGTTNGNWSGSACSIAPCGAGVYRCTIVSQKNASGNSTLAAVNALVNGSGSSSYPGDGTSGLYLWGAQLEIGAFATSYIPTTSAAVTRADDVSTSTAATRSSDVAQMTGTNFSSWYRADEGTFVTETYSNIVSLGGNGASGILSIPGSGSDRMSLFAGAAGNSQFEVVNGGATQAVISVASAAANMLQKIAVGYKLNDFAILRNGGSVSTDTSGSVLSGGASMSLGKVFSDGQLNGHIARLAYYPKALTTAELQGITA